MNREDVIRPHEVADSLSAECDRLRAELAREREGREKAERERDAIQARWDDIGVVRSRWYELGYRIAGWPCGSVTASHAPSPPAAGPGEEGCASC